MSAKCPECNGCMKVRGSHFKPNGHGELSALIRWFCKFCDKCFAREGMGVPLEEVQFKDAGIGKGYLRELPTKGQR
jgi:hypothetical protein